MKLRQDRRKTRILNKNYEEKRSTEDTYFKSFADDETAHAVTDKTNLRVIVSVKYFWNSL